MCYINNINWQINSNINEHISYYLPGIPLNPANPLGPSGPVGPVSPKIQLI